MLSEPSARPYFIRAVYQWCVDRGHTPYILAHWRAENYPNIPRRLADNDSIVFNISSPAVRGLVISDDGVCFTGRFLGKIVEVRVPLADVAAVYAWEVKKGFSFPPLTTTPSAPTAAAPGPGASSAPAPTVAAGAAAKKSAAEKTVHAGGKSAAGGGKAAGGAAAAGGTEKTAKGGAAKSAKKIGATKKRKVPDLRVI